MTKEYHCSDCGTPLSGSIWHVYHERCIKCFNKKCYESKENKEG